MHPLDQLDRRAAAREEHGLGQCNITKCCTEVCPEHIKITDNALIPLKERVADRTYDPVVWLAHTIRRRGATPRLTHPFFERPVLEVAPDLLGAHVSHRRGHDPPHRGRGVRRAERPGVARLPGAHPAHRRDVRARRAASTSTSATACTGAPTSCAGARAPPARSCCGPARWWRASTWRASRRGECVDRDLARGPARLAQALGLSREQNGLDVTRAGRPVRGPGRAGEPAPARVRSGPRVGVSGAGGDAAQYPWRFWLDGEPHRLGVPRSETASSPPHSGRAGWALTASAPTEGNDHRERHPRRAALAWPGGPDHRRDRAAQGTRRRARSRRTAGSTRRRRQPAHRQPGAAGRACATSSGPATGCCAWSAAPPG